MRIFLAVVMAATLAVPAQAGKLELSPVTVEVVAPTAASTVTLKNTSGEPAKLQARLFSWAQGTTGEQLQKTVDVVASPPFVELMPNQQAVIRIVRLSKRPVAGEESYRLLIDELPKKAAPQGSMIQMVMRYSLPVFFTDGQHGGAAFDMGIWQNGDTLTVSVGNHGGEHLKISGLKASDAGGHVVSFGNGLNGYVLAGASNNFSARGALNLKGPSITVSVNSNFGHLTTTVKLR